VDCGWVVSGLSYPSASNTTQTRFSFQAAVKVKNLRSHLTTHACFAVIQFSGPRPATDLSPPLAQLSE
jgi:hypothetical protein